MLQYQYYHTGREYTSRLSLSRDDESYYDNDRLFNTIREKVGGDAFVYGVLGNDFIMTQATSGNGFFVKGLRGSLQQLNDSPIKYAFGLETSVSDSDRLAEMLPDGVLPRLGKLQDILKDASKAARILPKLFDAVVYGEKQVVIRASDRESAVNIVKAFFKLFPSSYARKIGFCIGASEVPSEEISIVDSKMKYNRLSVKIWASDFPDFVFENLVREFVVFDTVTGQDNYTAESSSASKLLGALNLTIESDYRRFSNTVASAFDDSGAVDITRLNKCAAIGLFAAQRNTQAACAVLSLEDDGSGEQLAAYIDATRFLLEEAPADIAEQARNKFLELYQRNEAFSSELGDLLFNYYLSANKLLDAERDLFHKMLLDDESGVKLQGYLERSNRGEYAPILTAFNDAADILVENMKRNGVSAVANQQLISTIARFFDISLLYGFIPAEKTRSGEDFFDKIAKTEGRAQQVVLCATLVASACFRECPPNIAVVRFRGLMNLCDKLFESGLDKLRMVIEVRRKLMEIADSIGGLDFDNSPDFGSDFMFGNKISKNWIEDIIEGLSISELISVEYELDKDVVHNYSRMRSALRKVLLKCSFVSEFIKTNESDRKKYEEYFTELPVDIRESHPEITELLQELLGESQADKKLKVFRYNHALGYYQTTSENVKRHIAHAPSNSAPIDSDANSETQGTLNEQLAFVEEVAAKQKSVRKNDGTKSGSSVFILSFVNALISFVILLIPTIVIPLGIGTFEWQYIIDRFLTFFMPEFLFIPTVVFLFNVVAYTALGHDGARSAKLTWLCVISPVIVFVAAYLIAYFVV